MGQALGRAFNVTEYVFPVLEPTYDATHEFLVHFPSEPGIQVPAMLIAPDVGALNLLGTKVGFCIIYFHPNAADVGDCINEMETIRDGAFDGDAVLVAPEYPGYGLLIKYTPSVSGIDHVASAAWQYCTAALGFPASKIVLWGRSIGTGPATRLAHKLCCPPAEAKETPAAAAAQSTERALGGLVLLAPFISISAVVLAHATSIVSSLVNPMWEVQEMLSDDRFLDIPLVVLHPSEDDIVPPQHGKAVLDKAPCKHKLGIWLVNASHNFVLHEEHLEKVRLFMNRQFPRTPFYGREVVSIDFEDRSEPIESADRSTRAEGPNRVSPGLWRGGDREVIMESEQVYVDQDEELDRQNLIARLAWWGTGGRADVLETVD